VKEELVKRIEAAVESVENLEHRISDVVEGNRRHLSNLAEHLKIRQLRAELRAIAVAIREKDPP
jgi:hypothetical protein